MTTSTTRTPIPDPALGQSVPKQVPAARNGGYFYGRATPGEMEVLCSFSPRQSPPCRPLLWPWAPVSACGALLICWRVMDRTTQVPMLMCGKVTHKKLIDISPYYSESQVKINRFLKVCMIKYDYKKWTIRS